MRLVALLHLDYFVVDAALFAHFDNFFQGRVGVAVLQVEQDGIVKEEPVLRDYRDIFSEAFELQILHVLSVERYLAFFCVINSH